PTASSTATARPHQKNQLAPSSWSVAHEDSVPGTDDSLAIPYEYSSDTPRAIQPTASVTMSGFSPATPTRSPLPSPTSPDQASATTIATASLPFAPPETPTVSRPARVIVPGIDRSIPPIMITSISPSAATASTAIVASTVLSESFPSVSGATMAAIAIIAADASQTGRKPAPTRTLVSAPAARSRSAAAPAGASSASTAWAAFPPSVNRPRPRPRGEVAAP